MATPRQTIADKVKADNASFDVYAFPFAPTEVRSPVVAIWRTDLVPHPSTPGQLRHQLLVNAYVGPTLEEKAEAAADDLLDAVMLSLQRLDAVVFDSAQRTVFDGKFQGWAIKCHADSDNVYKSIVLTERP